MRREERRYTSARERADKQSAGFSSTYLKLPDKVQMFKVKAGTMLVDIIPFEAGKGNPYADKGMLHWERTFYVHRGIGANSDSYVCPRKNSDSPCPICEYRLKLMKENDEENEEMVKDLAPKQRQMFNVINLKDPDKGVQIWEVSYHLFGKVLDARLRNSDEEDEWDKFFFLEDGLTLKLGFADKSFGGVTFQEVETIDFKQRNKQYDEEILEEAHCLDDILVELDYDRLKKVFLQTTKEDDDKKDKDDDRRSRRDDDDDKKDKDKDDDDRKSSRRGRDDDDDDKKKDDDDRSSRRRDKEDDDDKDDDRKSSRRDDDDDDRKSRKDRDDDDRKSSRDKDDDKEEDAATRKARRLKEDDDDDKKDKDKDDDDRKSNKSSKKDDDDNWDDFEDRKSNKKK